MLFRSIAFGSISINQGYSQEIGLSTFQESAQVIIDEQISQTNIISITLLSSNIQEIKIPVELEEKIRSHERIEAIVITNENNCVLGVTEQSCILINIERNPEDKGINAIQESSKKIGELFIDEVNQIFDTNAEFFQIYIHSDAETNEFIWVDTSSKRLRENYNLNYADSVKYFETLFNKNGAGVINCEVDDSYVKKLLGYFKQR